MKIIIIEFSISVMIILACLLTIDKFDFTVNLFITVTNYQGKFVKFDQASILFSPMITTYFSRQVNNSFGCLLLSLNVVSLTNN